LFSVQEEDLRSLPAHRAKPSLASALSTSIINSSTLVIKHSEQLDQNVNAAWSCAHVTEGVQWCQGARHLAAEGHSSKQLQQLS